MTQFVILSWLDNPTGRSDVSLLSYHNPADAEVAITGCIETKRSWQFFVTEQSFTLEDLLAELEMANEERGDH